MLQAEQIAGGLADPVFDAQSVFRAVMDAMARPGTVRTIGRRTAPPQPLSTTTAAVALTLCDHDTPLWLDPALRNAPAVISWLIFHSGAPLAHTASEAHFALVADTAELIGLENFAQGTQEYPDRSATLVLQVKSLASGASLRLEGPGIERAAMLAPEPLPRHFVAQWTQNRARFPRGVDIVLAAPDAIACLPRTTHIQLAEG